MGSACSGCILNAELRLYLSFNILPCKQTRKCIYRSVRPTIHMTHYATSCYSLCYRLQIKSTVLPIIPNLMRYLLIVLLTTHFRLDQTSASSDLSLIRRQKYLPTPARPDHGQEVPLNESFGTLYLSCISAPTETQRGIRGDG